MNAIEAAGLVKQFDGFRAVDGVDLAVPEGSIYGILGPNGAGKTTMLRTLLGIIDQDEGTRTLLGSDRPISQSRNVGYLPEERNWLTKLFAGHGWLDSYRQLNPDGQDYTWWSQRGAARAKNVGWRIDYPVASPNLRERLKSCTIHPEPRFSDHAPYVVEYS